MTVWRAWYVVDGEIVTFDSTETDWADLPDDGILGVAIAFPGTHRYPVYGGDWFYLDDHGVPTCTETHPEWGRYIDPPDRPNVKQGEAIPDGEWDAVKMDIIHADL